MDRSNPADARADQLCFCRTVAAFRNYRAHAVEALEVLERSFATVTDEQAALLGSRDVLNGAVESHRRAIESNGVFLDDLANSSAALYEGYWPGEPCPPLGASEAELTPTPLDMDKVYSTLRQFVRDWSEEGSRERATIYEPVIRVLVELLPSGRVLLPGAGLSRLSVELAGHGFDVQGNEFSYHMLLGGHYAMNHLTERGAFTLQPFCDTRINCFSRRDQHRTIAIPDVAACEMMDEIEQRGQTFGELSMVAGDFTEVYRKPQHHEAWHAVVTCFFIDTAHNILEYIQIIHRMLQPGGLWINAGPLLYHFSGMAKETSVDLTYEELRMTMDRIGFDLGAESTLTTTYTNNSQSMKQMLYHCPFFWCRKRAPAPLEGAEKHKDEVAPSRSIDE